MAGEGESHPATDSHQTDEMMASVLLVSLLLSRVCSRPTGNSARVGKAVFPGLRRTGKRVRADSLWSSPPPPDLSFSPWSSGEGSQARWLIKRDVTWILAVSDATTGLHISLSAQHHLEAGRSKPFPLPLCRSREGQRDINESSNMD